MSGASDRSCGWGFGRRSAGVRQSGRLGLAALLLGLFCVGPLSGSYAGEVEPGPVDRPGAAALVQQAVEEAEAAAAAARIVADQAEMAAQSATAEHLTWDSGHTYSGQGYNNYANGLGVMSYPDGSVHAGQRANHNARNGYGVETYGDGNRYEGEFANDVRDGFGVFYYTDGSLYQGHFRDDWRNGFGRIIYPDGAVANGWWQDDNLVEFY